MFYKINEKTFEIEIFKENGKPPILRQPYFPNKSSWSSYEEAESWAKAYILSIEDKDAPFPPSGPGLSPIPKPSREQIRLIEIKRKVMRNELLSEEEAMLLANPEYIN